MFYVYLYFLPAHTKDRDMINSISHIGPKILELKILSTKILLVNLTEWRIMLVNTQNIYTTKTALEGVLVSYTNHNTQSKWLKTIQLFLSEFWRPEVRDQGISRAVLPLKAVRESPSLFLPASGSSRHSLVWSYPTQAWLLCWHHFRLLCQLYLLCISLIRTLVIHFRDHWTIQNDFRILKLIISAMYLFSK